MKLKTTLLAAATWCAVTATAQVIVTVDASQRGPKVSPTHYGIFYEDINHAADGGIYAELIRNRSFEDGRRFRAPADMESWRTEGEGIKAQLIEPSKKVKLLNAAQGHALELTLDGTARPVSLVNEGFWGINAVQGREYRLSFWVKGQYKGNIIAELRSKDGSTVYATTQVQTLVSKDWNKVQAR